MNAYDDSETSCAYCSIGLDYDALCPCDKDPLCVRCHRLLHVKLRRWGAPGWMGGAA